MAYIHVLGLQAPLCSAAHAPVVLCVAHWVWFLPSSSCSQALPFCTKLWSVNKNPGSGGQELYWRDAAFPGKDHGDIHQIQDMPSLCFAWQWCWQSQTIARGLLPWNVTSCAIWDGIRTRDTCIELTEGASEAPYLSTKVAGSQGKWPGAP